MLQKWIQITGVLFSAPVIRSSDSMLCSETHLQLGTCPSMLIFLEHVLGCFGLSVKDLFIESSDAL